jgi:hypothetical protein
MGEATDTAPFLRSPPDGNVNYKGEESFNLKGM